MGWLGQEAGECIISMKILTKIDIQGVCLYQKGRKRRSAPIWCKGDSLEMCEWKIEGVCVCTCVGGREGETDL